MAYSALLQGLVETILPLKQEQNVHFKFVLSVLKVPNGKF